MSNYNSCVSLLLEWLGLSGIYTSWTPLKDTSLHWSGFLWISALVWIKVLYLIFWRHADPCPQLLLSSTHSIFTAFEWLDLEAHPRSPQNSLSTVNVKLV